MKGRKGLGSIFVWASGNGGRYQVGLKKRMNLVNEIPLKFNKAGRVSCSGAREAH